MDRGAHTQSWAPMDKEGEYRKERGHGQSLREMLSDFYSTWDPELSLSQAELSDHESGLDGHPLPWVNMNWVTNH